MRLPLVEKPPAFSFVILLTLLLIFAASAAVFALLTRRWTRDRKRAAMEDWAREHRYRLHYAPHVRLPLALDSLQALNVTVDSQLTRGPRLFIRIVLPARPLGVETYRHLLIEQTDQAWMPAGLRPVGAADSLLDLFTISAYPALLPPERFVVHAADFRTAKAMADSPARGLLPPKVGLMLHGPYVTLDFSGRPFDSIEFERMLVVMQQVIPKLPAPVGV